MAYKTEAHELIADLKRVAAALGHAPSRREYEQHGGVFAERQFRNHFKGFSPAIIAAGLQGAVVKEKPRKITAEDVFGRDINEHLTEYFKAAYPVTQAPRRQALTSTAVVGDLHFPFTNLNTLTAFYHFISTHRPARIVQMGDLYDMFAHSKFPGSMNIYTPKQEMDLAQSMARDFWKKCQEIVPGVECHLIMGNHDVRPLKRILESYPAGEMFFNIRPWFEFEGVKTLHDSREELILDGVAYHHGFRGKLGDHRDHNLMNSVVGHTHRGGVVNRQIRGEVLWELNAGYMGDPLSKALSYTPSKISHWTQGWGWVDEWGARFIPV